MTYLNTNIDSGITELSNQQLDDVSGGNWGEFAFGASAGWAGTVAGGAIGVMKGGLKGAAVGGVAGFAIGAGITALFLISQH